MSFIVIKDGQFLNRRKAWVNEYPDASLWDRVQGDFYARQYGAELVSAEDYEDGTYAAQQAAAVRQAHLDAPKRVLLDAAKSAVDEKRRHGGPADRGSADRYYGRPREPHYYLRGTHTSPLVGKDRMTDQQIAEYNAAYDAETDRKDWG